MQDHTLTYWQTSLQYIKQNVPADIYKASFEPLQFVSFDEGLLKVGVPNKLFAELFESNYAKYFLQVVSHYCGRSVRLKYVIEQKPAENVAPNPILVTPSEKEINRYRVTPQQTQAKMPPLDSQLNRRYTFENFVEGGSNKLSRSVGLSIAESPGKSAFNPFFLYGPSGVGKTHLVNAIGVRIKQLNPEKRVLFVSAHVFKPNIPTR